MLPPHQPSVRNQLLRILAGEDFDRLALNLKPVALPMREVLIAKNEPITHVWFVETGLICLLVDAVDDRIEIGMVGNEGMVGVPVVLGTDRTPHVALVQAEGTAWRMAASDLRSALDASPALREVLGRYVQSMMVQVGETAQANADLTIDGRLARWVLMTQDRLERDELPLTHQLLATMLSVRRPSITTATHVLESAGMIRAQRGRITVLDRGRLIELAGDAYGNVKNCLLPATPSLG